MLVAVKFVATVAVRFYHPTLSCKLSCCNSFCSWQSYFFVFLLFFLSFVYVTDCKQYTTHALLMRWNILSQLVVPQINFILFCCKCLITAACKKQYQWENIINKYLSHNFRRVYFSLLCVLLLSPLPQAHCFENPKL